ncbi:MAG: transposase zinc-binding domain-containing protein [Candidatus Wallbacteria bacterium]|nr:transposase zinc-binding domain-containing protein [Candidatus Wallbacteria bacterium]
MPLIPSSSGEASAAPEPFPKLLGEYQRRQPEQTVLYQCVQENYRSFVALYEEQDRALPAFVRREFEKYLECGVLSGGFARVRCGDCGFDRLVAFSWRVFSADVFVCSRCRSSNVKRIAWITDASAIRKILNSVSLATDGPAPQPARSAEELFGQAASA